MDVAVSRSRGYYRGITDADMQDEENAGNGQGEIGHGRAILPHIDQGEIEAGRTAPPRTGQEHPNAWEEE